MRAAVNMQDLSGHEAGGLEIEHGIDDLPDLAQAMNGMQAG